MKRLPLFAFLCLANFLAGCASTKVETSGMVPREALCQAGSVKLSALVLWGPIWRPNQKDVALREATALRGIEQYLANSSCLTKADIRRLQGERLAVVPSDPELLALASAELAVPDRVLVVVVRELGPVIRVGIPALVEGGTVVVLEVRVLNTHSRESLVNDRIHWKNGGTFVIKGVKTLEHDMSNALEAALTPVAIAK